MSNLRRRKAMFVGDSTEKSQFLNDISDPEHAYILAVHLNLKQPLSIKQLSTQTHFTQREIRWIYRRFKNEAQNAIVHRDFVRNLFSAMFRGDAEHYADLVFDAFDVDRAGSITFEAFLRALSVLLRGNLDEKLEFIYPLYDPLRSGTVSWERVLCLVTAVDDLIGIETRPRLTRSERARITDFIFRKFDPDRTGQPVSKQRFLDVCRNDENIRSSIENIVAAIKL